MSIIIMFSEIYINLLQNVCFDNMFPLSKVFPKCKQRSNFNFGNPGKIEFYTQNNIHINRIKFANLTYNHVGKSPSFVFVAARGYGPRDLDCIQETLQVS
jgi:hypothetical protein